MRVERSADAKSYRSASGWKPIERTTETVISSSGASRVTVTIERTEWGPLMPAGPRGVSGVEKSGRNVRARVDGASSSRHEPALAPTRNRGDL